MTSSQWATPRPENLPPCTRCGHHPDDHRISSDAAVQDPTDERARFYCIREDCECANYERWTRP